MCWMPSVKGFRQRTTLSDLLTMSTDDSRSDVGDGDAANATVASSSDGREGLREASDLSMLCSRIEGWRSYNVDLLNVPL